VNIVSSQHDGIDVEQYKTQAKELLKSAKSAEPAALERFSGFRKPIKLADAQLIIARDNGHESWPKFQAYLLFRQAVRAFDAGDEKGLARLLTEHPGILNYRCRRGQWYESGYFKGAMLLHHVAGNPIRCRLPENVVSMARLILERGAEADATTDDGGTTVGLLLTSRQSSEAATALPIIKMLGKAGARTNLGPDALLAALTNGARGTAEALILEGATMDLRHAAALGRLEDMQTLIAKGQTHLLEEALVMAAFWNENPAAKILIDHGAKGDVLLRPGKHAPQTALHNAANSGNRELVEMLINAGADSGVKDGRWEGTPADWARHAGHEDLARFIEAHEP